jgi:hypothetical protein
MWVPSAFLFLRGSQLEKGADHFAKIHLDTRIERMPVTTLAAETMAA